MNLFTQCWLGDVDPRCGARKAELFSGGNCRLKQADVDSVHSHFSNRNCSTCGGSRPQTVTSMTVPRAYLVNPI
ncbi:hypothetical protein RBB76_25795, partial [Tunturiibacter psychrotolerans]|uniref:hypothetical protein n=1 Tax=Tunturiibacter psychrotolerans TaxID=3069686 RepID=UPI003D9B0F08